ncbi:hypothetical protein AXG93_3256s1130 [Marchantia polymorpha subsp. ruderalis]|uniref:Uncharacterized protein n=1 Tax=Marchantia polymorpha subsp. ruderalis TaxID=1480154 RepID=A0A176VJY0_MARPO|nr:hypothetical protein AXG93_3256s1130 [Marchantia polymorpha subsp. ruderalis]
MRTAKEGGVATIVCRTSASRGYANLTPMIEQRMEISCAACIATTTAAGPTRKKEMYDDCRALPYLALPCPALP